MEITAYHGTTVPAAELIQEDGFRVSGEHEELGACVYFTEDIEKAKRFAHDAGMRFPGREGERRCVMKVTLLIESGRLHDCHQATRGWAASGYHACRAQRTSRSKTTEIGVLPGKVQIRVQEVQAIAGCPFDRHHFPCYARASHRACPCS
eukprot:TRINITY_DN9678_c0_g1_i1.p2 TRINITY_DN9678_c0_g1~~TRINITY_DN9678_c0_g1_i1.p2  ORF type:complete len:176 (+),score=37.29 TRINITY_DN9678_c0_g1_i1:79-528(+)